MWRPFPDRRDRHLSPAPFGKKSQRWISPVGIADPVSLDGKMANSSGVLRDAEDFITCESWRFYLTVLVVAGPIYMACIASPSALMDDVDAVHAHIARTMLTSGDFVTARLDGLASLEKAPLV